MRKALVLLVVLHAGAAAAEADPPSPDAVVAVLEELRGELEWPGLTVDAAAAALKAPQEALRFVRDDVMLVNYRGSYADPDGVLRTRVANATDKAYLLAILLQKMKVKVHMARSDWPAGAQPHQGPGPRRPLPALKKLADLLGPAGDAAAITPGALSDRQLQDLRDEVAASQRAVEKLLAAAGRDAMLKGSPEAKDVEPIRVDTDWVWVRAQLDGKTWTDLDPVFPKRPRPAKVEAPFGFMPVAVTVRLEGVRKGQTQGDSLLQWRGPSHAILGHDLLVSYFPATGGAKAANEPEKVALWRPYLTCASLQLAGKEFAPSGGPGKPVAEKAEPAGDSGAGGGGGVGGALGGIFGAAKKPEPKPAAAGYDHLRLVIEFGENGGKGPWSAAFSRVVQYIGPGYDPHELIAAHRIALGMAFVPVRVVESRMVDEVIEVYRLRQAADKGEAVKAVPARGYSSRTAKILNSMFFLKHLAAPAELKIGWTGPAVFVETYQLRKVKNQLYFASRLDTLHEAFGPQAGSSRRHRILWGLATPAAEARLLKTQSVNQHLLAAQDTLRVVAGAEGVAQPGRLDGEAIQKAVLSAGGVLVASAAAPSSVWAMRPTGDLLGVFVDVPSGAAAKGAGTMARSDAAGEVFAALADGAMSSLGCPAGMLVTPLHRYFQELAKAYLKAASVLEGLAKTIETGDDSHMKDAEQDYFENLDRHLANAMGRGFVEGWADSVAGEGIGHVLGSGGRYPMTDRAIDGLVAADLSMPIEVPGFTPLVTRAMEAVTIAKE